MKAPGRRGGADSPVARAICRGRLPHAAGAVQFRDPPGLELEGLLYVAEVIAQGALAGGKAAARISAATIRPATTPMAQAHSGPARRRRDSFSLRGSGHQPYDPKHEPTESATFRFEIFRYDAAPRGRAARLQATTWRSAGRFRCWKRLLRIQDEQDPSLAFRYSCRGAVCGSCGMSINGRLNLACRVQLHLLAGRRVVLEPLPGLEIVKDLVVNMDPFWEKYRRIAALAARRDSPPPKTTT